MAGRAGQALGAGAGPALAVWGAGTGAGKTVVSAGLAAAAARARAGAGAGAGRGAGGASSSGPAAVYIKPLQTGALGGDSDGRLVAAAAAAVGRGGGRFSCAPHAAAAYRGVRPLGAPPGLLPAAVPSGGVWSRTLFAWGDAVGPHLAARRERRPVADHEVLEAVRAEMSAWLGAPRPPGLCLLESAGGPCSPGPNAALQADLFRPLRLPGLLVGGGDLGGIHAVVSAAESLVARGYDLAAVVLLQPPRDQLENHEAVKAALERWYPHPVCLLPQPPAPPPPAADARGEEGGEDPLLDSSLLGWLRETQGTFDGLLQRLEHGHQARRAGHRELPGRALRSLWYPFTQHAATREEDLLVVDSRCGEDLLVSQGPGESLEPRFDASASWWTQGPSADLQMALAQVAGHATGRYGHVIHPETATEAVVGCAEKLLEAVGGGWADRVFFSDDGSTAVEVALKMAFRKTLVDQLGESPPFAEGPHDPRDIIVLGQEGAYHGDTLGAMDLVPPSVYVGRGQQPWYRPRVHALRPPRLCLVRGAWEVQPPDGCTEPIFEDGSSYAHFQSLEEALSLCRDDTELATGYACGIEGVLDSIMESKVVGALMLEPLLLGAGGMVLVDPLWQRQLVRACRRRGVPVIFDEVFTGIWRLGAPSAAHLLGVDPDVSCFAKLLTGGTVPLSATLASKEVFEAFVGDSKAEALLHGHSYSGHPLGCALGLAALDAYADPRMNPNFRPGPGGGRLADLWEGGVLAALSTHPRVRRVAALGTVCAAELHTDDGGGYSSGAAREVTRQLQSRGVYSRPLGNVVYLMCSPFTAPEVCERMLRDLISCLDGGEA